MLKALKKIIHHKKNLKKTVIFRFYKKNQKKTVIFRFLIFYCLRKLPLKLIK